MNRSFRLKAKRALRIATLLVPSVLAWLVTWRASTRSLGDLGQVLHYTLGPLWLLVAATMVLRLFVAAFGRGEARPSFEPIDVLTGRGSALAWLSALAIMLSAPLGYASLAVVGMLGTGLFHVVVLHALVALRGRDPMRVSAFTRRIEPPGLTEGDAAIEEIHVAGARIPIGFRLFMTGRVGPRWATSRHVLTASDSGAELVLESDVGPAVRGEHEPEPLEVWLEDTFGLCHSPLGHVKGSRLTVQPRTREIAAVPRLLDHGVGPRAPRAAFRLPTEGCFDLREYKAGDDVRRIHWVRSIVASKLVVRLPDELPPDRPRARLVLDTFFPEVFALDCDAPSEMLDALVAVWLAVGRALVESGVRVTLVTALGQGTEVEKMRLELSRQSFGAALRLGARLSWQNRMPLASLVTDEATFVVSRGVTMAAPVPTNLRWIVVAPPIAEPAWAPSDALYHRLPMGSSENRWSERRRSAEALARQRTDHTRAMIAMCSNFGTAGPGSLVALIGPAGALRLEPIHGGAR